MSVQYIFQMCLCDTPMLLRSRSLVLLLSELALPASRVPQVRVNREHRERGEQYANQVPSDRGPDAFEIGRLHQTGKFDEFFVNGIERMGSTLP